MAKPDEFSFGLPLFMLAVRDTPGQFVAYSDAGKNMALVFTSVAAAQARLDAFGQGDALAIAAIETPEAFLTFLRTAVEAKQTHLIFDMHPKTMTGRVIPVKLMLRQIGNGVG